MTIAHVAVPDELQSVIDRRIDQGLCASTSAFLIEAAERFVEHLETEAEIAAIVQAADSALEAGDYVTINGPEDEAALREQVMARIRSRLMPE
jgi:hypothetical protein